MIRVTNTNFMRSSIQSVVKVKMGPILPDMQLGYSLSENTMPNINKSLVDFNAPTSNNFDASTIDSYYSATNISDGGEIFANVDGKLALKLDSNAYAVGYDPNDLVNSDKVTTTLFHSTNNIWKNGINLNTNSHTFSVWINVEQFQSTQQWDQNQLLLLNNNTDHDPVVSMYENYKVEYLNIGLDRRPQMWYKSRSSSPHYNRYKMDIVLNENTWYHIAWTFDRINDSQFNIKGYVNGSLKDSFYDTSRARNLYATHYKDIGPNENVENFYSEPTDGGDATPENGTYLTFGTRFPTHDTLEHVCYIKDVRFDNNKLDQAQLQFLYRQG